MGQSLTAKPDQTAKRKAKLSPELNEFLHMLKSLENEFDVGPTKR